MDRESRLGSIVVPCFNEESNIAAVFSAIKAATDSLDLIGEIIFVDDGSTDGTYAIIQDLAMHDARVKCLRFSRNFGSHAAVTAGLRRARGVFAVILSADLQDPPELIPELVKVWQKGFHVVWATRSSRADSGAKTLLASAFYTLLRRVALPQYPAQGMDFGLFDRKVLDAFKGVGDVVPFLTGTILWMGFRQTFVEYDRRSRLSGVSKWTTYKSFRLALDAIFGFSEFPLRLISAVGLVLAALGVIAGMWLVGKGIFSGFAGSGWTAVAVILLVLEGIQLLMLGILAEYLWRGFEQVKGRPQFIIMDEIGFSGPEN